MDQYSEISKGMEDLISTFSDRMDKYDRDLQLAATSTSPQDISGLAQQFSDFKSLIWKALGVLKSQIEHLGLGLDRHEQMMRRKVLLVHGVAEEPEEQPVAVLTAVLANRLKSSDDCLGAIKVVHRLGAKGAKTRPLLVRFTSHEARSEVWDSKKALKGTGITLTEFLTKSRHDVFMAARQHFGVSNSWTTDGRIFVQLPNKTRRKVECWAELRPLMDKFPSKEPPQSAVKGKKPAVDMSAASTRGVVTRRGASQARAAK